MKSKNEITFYGEKNGLLEFYIDPFFDGICFKKLIIFFKRHYSAEIIETFYETGKKKCKLKIGNDHVELFYDVFYGNSIKALSKESCELVKDIGDNLRHSFLEIKAYDISRRVSYIRSKKENYYRVLIDDMPGWDDFEELVKFLEINYCANILESFDGLDIRRCTLRIDNQKINLRYDDYDGNSLEAPDKQAEELITRIGEDIEERLEKTKYFDLTIHWKKSGGAEYPYEILMNEGYFQIRVNDFPEELLYSLLIDGEVIVDFNNWPDKWKK